MPRSVTLRWKAIRTRRRSTEPTGYDYQAFIPDPIRDTQLSLPGETALLVSGAESESPCAQPWHDERWTRAVGAPPLRAESVASSRIEGLEVSHRRLAKADYSDDRVPRRAPRAVGAGEHASDGSRREGAAAARRAFRVEDLAGHSPGAVLGVSRTSAPGASCAQSRTGLAAAASSPRDAEVRAAAARSTCVPPAPMTSAASSSETTCRRSPRPPWRTRSSRRFHPFADGNGRVGRALIHVVLKRRGVAPKLRATGESLVLATDNG